MTINGGLGTDTVEFATGDYARPAGLEPHRQRRAHQGRPGRDDRRRDGDINFNAVYRDVGLSAAGFTTTIPFVGDDALVDINGATLIKGHTITMSATSGTLSTTVNGASQDLTGGNLIVAAVDGFSNDGGDFTVVGGSGDLPLRRP